MKKLSFLLLTGALSACAAPARTSGDWPPALPPESYFTRVYQQDARNAERQTLPEYLGWVVRFYHGYGLVPGWTKNEDLFCRDLNADEYALLAPRLHMLGQLAAAEWAKHNESRRIDTDQVQIWGRTLKKAVQQRKLARTVDRLLEDVQSMLQGTLDSRAVTAERYHDLLSSVSSPAGSP